MKIPFNKKWIVLEREDYAHYLFVTNTWEGFTAAQKKWGFMLAHWLSAEYHHKAVNLFITLDSYREITASYFETIFTNPKLWEQLHRETREYSDALVAISKKIRILPVRELANKELLKWRLAFEARHKETHSRRGPMFFIEAVDNMLTKYLIDYLTERINDLGVIGITPFYAFQILTTPLESSIQERGREKLITIALIKNKERQERALQRYVNEYAWVEYGLVGKVLDAGHFRRELAVVKRRNPKRLLEKMKQERTELHVKQSAIMERLKIHGQHRTIFKIAADAIFYKAYSKDAQFYGYWSIERLLREIGRRGGLTLEQVRYLAIPDYKEVLLKGKDLSDLANERMKYSLHFSDKGKTLFYVGDDARKIHKKLKFVKSTETVKKGQSINGQPAFAGRAKGRVKIINTPQEMLKMHQGDVLVSHMTNPDIVPAMKKASAIVTDLGGITCHAAIVSRELKIPCVIGTKIATQVLKDGDRVEVAAEKGMVKKIK